MGSEGLSHFFPFFFAFLCFFFSVFFVFFRFSSCFFVFLGFLRGQEQTTAIYWENGEFHSDPVCTEPVQDFPSIVCLPSLTRVRSLVGIHSWSAAWSEKRQKSQSSLPGPTPEKSENGKSIIIQCRCWKSHVLPVQVPNPRPNAG